MDIIAAKIAGNIFVGLIGFLVGVLVQCIVVRLVLKNK